MKRRCSVDDVIQAHARAATKDRSVQPPESMVVKELRCAHSKAAVTGAIRRGVLRRGTRGLYVPAGVDPGAAYIFRRGRKGQLAGPSWSEGDRVRVYAPGTPWNGRVGTITEMRKRRSGSISYTVTVDGREILVSEGSLRQPKE